MSNEISKSSTAENKKKWSDWLNEQETKYANSLPKGDFQFFDDYLLPNTNIYPFQPVSGVIGSNHFFANGDTSRFYSQGLFSTFFGSADFKIMNLLPLTLSANMVVQDEKIRPDLSSFSVHFDRQIFLDEVRKKLLNQKISQAIQNLPPDDRIEMLTFLKTERLHQIVNTNGFKMNRASIDCKIDSLESSLSIRDSLSANNLKMELANMDSAISLTHKFRGQAYEQTNLLRRRIFEIENKLRDSSAAIESMGDPAALKKALKRAAPVKGFEKLFFAVKGLELGTFFISESPFTLWRMRLNGGHIALNPGKYFVEFGSGKEAQPKYYDRDNQSFQLGFRGQGRNAYWLRGGLGTKESDHFLLGYTYVQANTDPIGTVGGFEKRNAIISCDTKKSFWQNLVFKCDVAVSNADFSGQKPFSELLAPEIEKQTMHGLAVQSSIALQSKTNHKDLISFGYTYTSSGFVSLGNPYLLKNRQSLLVEFRKHLLKNRLGLNAIVNKGVGVNDIKLLYPKMNNTQLSAEILYRLKKNTRVGLRYAPQYILVQTPGTAETAISQYNVYALTTTFVNRIAQNRLYSSLITTNFNSEQRYGDTILLTGLVYFQNQETFIMGKQQLASMLNIGYDLKNQVGIKDFNWQVLYSNNVRKLQSTLGTRLSKRFYDQTFWVGGSLGLQYTSKKGSTVGINLQGLQATKRTQHQSKEWYGDVYFKMYIFKNN